MQPPSPLTLLLLRACFDRDALADLRAWEAAVDIEDHDADAHGLLPLLKYSADTYGWTLQHEGRIGGVYRFWWTRNMLALRALAAVFDVFQSEQIEVMALDDAALAIGAYARPALRPIERLTLLIHPEQQQAAYQALQNAGWIAHGWIPKRRQPYIESLGFTGQEQLHLTLRWFALDRRCAPHIDDGLWQCAVQQPTLNDRRIRIPSPSDQLVLRAARLPIVWATTSPSLQLADVITLIQTGEIDWEQVVGRVSDYRLTQPFLKLLTSACALVSLPVPDQVITQLSAPHRSWIAAAESAAFENDLPLPAWQSHLIRWWRSTDGLPSARRMSSGAHYVRRWFNLPVPRFLRVKPQ